MNNERSEQLIAWLRANWQQPRQPESQLQQRIAAFARDYDTAVVLDFWKWDEAVALIVSSAVLARMTTQMKTIYPDGFLLTDQQLLNGLLVDFDDEDGVQIAEIKAR